MASNGLARTPPLGWVSGKGLGAKIDAKTVKEVSDALVVSGLVQAGYRYVVLDEGWQGVADWKESAEYLHSKGLKFGLAAAGEEKSCGGAEGSAGREEADARRFAGWGVDYLKYEWCGKLQATATVRAGARKMATALRGSGREVVFSVVPRGVRNPEVWAAADGANAWRVGPDQDGTWAGFSRDFDLPLGLETFAGPGRWNELDAMLCGTGLRPSECRAEMSLRALMAAPVFLGDDPRSLAPGVKEIVANPEVIAIHQDPLGRAGRKIEKWLEREVWARPLAGGSYAVGLFNRGKDTEIVRISIASLDFRMGARVRDVWKHKSLGRFDDQFSTTVEPHGVVLLRLDP